MKLASLPANVVLPEPHHSRVAFDDDVLLFAAHEQGQLIVNDFDHELARRNGREHVAAHSLILNLIGYFFGNLIVNVGIDQRAANFLDGRRNVDFRNRALPFKGLNGPVELGGEIIKHSR